MTNTCQREFNLVGRKDKKGITKLRIFDAVVGKSNQNRSLIIIKFRINKSMKVNFWPTMEYADMNSMSHKSLSLIKPPHLPVNH